MQVRKIFAHLVLFFSPLFSFYVAGAVAPDDDNIFSDLTKVKLVSTATDLSSISTDAILIADILHFCGSGRLPELTLSWQEVGSVSATKVEAIGACFKQLADLFESISENYKDNENFKANYAVLKNLAAESDSKAVSAMPIVIKSIAGESEQITSQVGVYTIDLSTRFQVSQGAEGNAPTTDGSVVYSVTGCNSKTEALAEESAAPATKADIGLLANRLAEINQFQGVLTCELNDKSGELAVMPIAKGAGEVVLVARAEYRSSKGAVLAKSKPLPITIAVKSSSSVFNCDAWSCQYGANFLLGVEGATIEDVKSDSILRYEFSSYSILSKKWFHIFGRIYQTSTVEYFAKSMEAVATSDNAGTPVVAANDIDCSTPSDEEVWLAACDKKVTSAISGELGTAFFLMRSTQDHGVSWSHSSTDIQNGDLLAGPTFQFNVMKSERQESEFEESYYTGLRFAYSRVQYFDILYGKNEELSGRRWKLKGQAPVYNNNFVAGVEIDVAADNEYKKKYGDGSDSIKFYVTYVVDFGNFIK
ncbi:hypothetical protein [Halioxenophilus sp. WMMB6]|uniref:hypothetical protein n=1 Tax=Halioxenophilus sp. WMMB6 TaxID=3073815 RepID=UPI00295E4868|nr:hypothetical protein [Halioxenophilus sp. WMMB6]